MRVQQGIANIEFARFLGQMSYTPELQGQISLPAGIKCFHDIQVFCNSIFPTTCLQNANNNLLIFCDRTILAFRNDTVTMFNDLLIQQLPGELHIFNSVNTADINDSAAQTEELPAEYLQSIQHAALPLMITIMFEVRSTSYFNSQPESQGRSMQWNTNGGDSAWKILY